MRVVLVHRYFWPDTPPYAHILRSIAERLGEVGHDVIVLTCQPSYTRSAIGCASKNERLASGVQVRRWSVLPDRRFAVLKALNLLLFCVHLLSASRKLGRVDVVMAASFPPIAVAKVASWIAARKGARFVYHKQDIYPDVMTAPGILRDSSRTAALRRLDARTERIADRVVVLSEDMAETIVARGASRDRVEVINNFDPWSESDEHSDDIHAHGQIVNGNQLNVVFAGNLGRFQNLDTVIAATVQLAHDDRIAFHFFGDGALRRELEHETGAHGLGNVYFYGYQPPSRVASFLREQADLGIVSLAPGVIKAAYPSKTMSYLRQGCPVLTLVEAHSDLALTITQAGAGVQADPSDASDVATTLRRLADNPTELAGAGRRAAELYNHQFSRNRQLAKWVALFERIAREMT